LTPAEGRKFAFTVGLAFLALGAFVWWRGALTPAKVFDAVGGVLLVLGLVAPRSLGPIQRAWMSLALLISKVTTPIFMGVVFFLVITPTGLLMRLFGKRLMRTDSAAPSYWHARPEGTRRSNLERQF
jgi:hypothetical protein